MSISPPPQRILIIRPSALGDVCRTVPVLASLRSALPDARIDWIVQDDFAPAIASHPALNEVIRFPRSRLGRWWRSPRRLVQLLQWFSRLRKSHYDVVLDCQGLGRSGLMTRLTGAPRRVGLRSARELAWAGYNIRVPPPTGSLHTVDHMLALVEAIGVEAQRNIRLYNHESDVAWWIAQRNELEISGDYAVLAPTTRWISKRWPIDRFGLLIEPLLARGFEHSVIIGSPGEIEQVAPLMIDGRQRSTRSTVINLVGKSTIGQTMAVIAQAGLVIANDSAPLHMAVGFDRPCVGLYGPTDPAIVGPYQREHGVVRGYAAKPQEQINFKSARLGDRLMRLISTAAVLQKIDQVLAEWSGQTPERERAKPQSATRDAYVEGAA